MKTSKPILIQGVYAPREFRSCILDGLIHVEGIEKTVTGNNAS
ncbi:MAG: hypothetical protein QXE10_07525 [Desulfurococcaceae archaeon]